jgi:HEAT repeat protein
MSVHMYRQIQRNLQLLAVSIVLGGVCGAQTTNLPANSVPDLRHYFEDLVQQYEPSRFPPEQALRVAKRIASLTSGQISELLPAVFDALSHPNQRVQTYAAEALVAISHHGDSAALLSSRISEISRLLDSSDEELQNGAVVILSRLRPTPPQSILKPLVTFLSRSDRSPRAQVSAIWTLVRIAPTDVEVEAEVNRYMAKPLQMEEKIDILHALGIPSVALSRPLMEKVIAALEDPEPAVRKTAIASVARIGPVAINLAKPQLQAIAKRSTEDRDVRQSAEVALQSVAK